MNPRSLLTVIILFLMLGDGSAYFRQPLYTAYSYEPPLQVGFNDNPGNLIFNPAAVVSSASSDNKSLQYASIFQELNYENLNSHYLIFTTPVEYIARNIGLGYNFTTYDLGYWGSVDVTGRQTSLDHIYVNYHIATLGIDIFKNASLGISMIYENSHILGPDNKYLYFHLGSQYGKKFLLENTQLEFEPRFGIAYRNIFNELINFNDKYGDRYTEKYISTSATLTIKFIEYLRLQIGYGKNIPTVNKENFLSSSNSNQYKKTEFGYEFEFLSIFSIYQSSYNEIAYSSWTSGYGVRFNPKRIRKLLASFNIEDREERNIKFKQIKNEKLSLFGNNFPLEFDISYSDILIESPYYYSLLAGAKFKFELKTNF